MATTEVAVMRDERAPSKLEMEFSNEQIELLKRTVCKGGTNDELALFLHICKKTGLDPISRQIYAVKRWDKTAGREVMTTQTGIDGFRVVAERSGMYEGQDGPYFCGEDGVWTDVWLKKTPPFAAKIGVFKKGFRQALYRVAKWDEYVQKGKEGPTKFWASMPCGQLAKCAESLALRSAFPQDLSGIYSAEEMDQSDNGGSDAAAQDVAKRKIAAGELAKAQGGSPSAAMGTVVDAEFVDSPENTEAEKLSDAIKTFPPKDTASTRRATAQRSLKEMHFDMLKGFGILKRQYQAIGKESSYYAVLGRHGVEKSNEFPVTAAGLKAGGAAYVEMQLNVQELEASVREHPEPPAAA